MLEQELTTLLTQFEDCWCRLKPTELRSLWDPEEENPYYIAEEIPDPMYDWSTIEKYWAEAESILEKFTIRTLNLKCKPLGPHHAVMNFTMHWNGLLRAMPHSPMGLDVRVSAVVRNTPDGWRFCHYVESPLGPFPYLQATYGQNVDPGFMTS